MYAMLAGIAIFVSSVMVNVQGLCVLVGAFTTDDDRRVFARNVFIAGIIIHIICGVLVGVSIFLGMEDILGMLGDYMPEEELPAALSLLTNLI